MKSLIKNVRVLLVLMLLLFTTLIFSQSSGYEINGTINIGGSPRWDYLSIDNSTDRLYVSNKDKVYVIDLKKNVVIGEIDSLNGVHGIAIVEEAGKAFISNGGNDNVTVFDLKSFRVLANIHVTGKNPDAIVYDAFTKRIFTFNGRSSNATAIDVKTNKVLGTLNLDGKPEFAVSNEKGQMYVNIENKSEITEFNPKTFEIIHTWPISPGKSPSGLAIDIKNNLLFSGCDNNLMIVVNTNTGKVIAALTIGSGVDACEFDPETHFAFSSNGEGTLTVVKEMSPNKFQVIDNVKTVKRARTMALDKSTHNIYLSTMIEGKENSQNFGVLILKKK